MQSKILQFQLFALHNDKLNKSTPFRIPKWLQFNLVPVDISNKINNHVSCNMTLHDVEMIANLFFDNQTIWLIKGIQEIICIETNLMQQ